MTGFLSQDNIALGDLSVTGQVGLQLHVKLQKSEVRMNDICKKSQG
jgi:hypothetical protein